MLLLICLTILTCGIALFFRQYWAVQIGAIASTVYLALVVISLLIVTIFMFSKGLGGPWLKGLFFAIPNFLLSCFGPVALIYIYNNEDS